MNTITWILTAVLAVVFTVSGVAKSTMSRDRLIASGQTGIAPFPMPLVRVVAVSELFAVAGLFAPWLTDTARVLTPLAALGLSVSPSRWRPTPPCWPSPPSSPPAASPPSLETDVA